MYKFEQFNFGYVLIFCIVSILPSYLIFYEICANQTDSAYRKIKSIKEESLTQFYTTKDINTIPISSRYAWIGIRYKKINIVDHNFSGEIKAVGWKGENVFAYYEIDRKKYTGSYH
ncbi:MAG: hypothetical protein IPK03_16550 [Bacteroidetes bacterium]|nr:hypothetical protein [Bacteroidota bacterium]